MLNFKESVQCPILHHYPCPAHLLVRRAGWYKNEFQKHVNSLLLFALAIWTMNEQFNLVSNFQIVIANKQSVRVCLQGGTARLALGLP